LLALVLASSAAHAQSDLRAISYQGYLEQDGSAVSGTRELTFKLFDAPTAGTQLGSNIVATVTVYSGSFATVLAPIPVQAFSTQKGLYLEIAVDGVTLSGRQRIYAVPFALGTSRGDDMVVTGSLGLGGAAPAGSAALVVGSGANGQGGATDTLFAGSTIDIPLGDEAAGGLVLRDAQSDTQKAQLLYQSGNQHLKLLNAGKGLTVNTAGTLTIDGVDVVFASDAERGEGGRALVHGTSDRLVLNFASDFAGGTRVDGNLDVGGTLQTGGDTSVGGTLQTTGDTTIGGSLQTGNTGCRTDACTGVTRHDVSGGEGWGSWRGRTYCPAHKYVCGIEQRVEGDQNDGDDTAVNDIAIVCCPF
jgi:hypothetical protein